MYSLMTILAQQTDTPGYDIGKTLAQTGIAGAAVWWALRAEKRAEAAEERERTALRDQREILERLVPVIIAGTEAAKEMQHGMARQVDYVRGGDVQALPNEMRESLDRITRSLESLDDRLPGRRKGNA